MLSGGTVVPIALFRHPPPYKRVVEADGEPPGLDLIGGRTGRPPETYQLSDNYSCRLTTFAGQLN
ncbi:MAG: hypothetical protein RIR52_1247 [Acidobacteriota bacterium]